MTTIELFGESCCRLCAHWLGAEAHVIDQVPAICREHSQPALGRHPRRTYADESCPQFMDASRKRAA